MADVLAFLVTPEGVFLANTSDPGVSAWLRAQLAERFGVPVRYVAYTHLPVLSKNPIDAVRRADTTLDARRVATFVTAESLC